MLSHGTLVSLGRPPKRGGSDHKHERGIRRWGEWRPLSVPSDPGRWRTPLALGATTSPADDAARTGHLLPAGHDVSLNAGHAVVFDRHCAGCPLYADAARGSAM